MPGPLAIAAMTAAGSLAEGFISSAFNLRSAAQNRRFQQRMSDTAHQREVEDLKRAGLNPILSVNHGASTPSGSAAQAVPTSATQRAMEAVRLQSDINLQKAQTMDLNSSSALKDAQKGDITYSQQERVQLMLAQARAALATGEHTEQDIRRINQEIKNLEQQYNLLRLEQSHSALDLNRMRREAEFYKSGAGKLAPFMKFAPFTGSAPSILRR